MRVLVCPTAFKGTLTAGEAARTMAAGVRRSLPTAEVERMPLSDGGPGFLEALLAADVGGRLERMRIPGPLDDPVEGRILRSRPEEALIESADACGLERLAGRRAPLAAHTLGVGRLVARALAGGARDVRIGLGGSATTDGGTGLGRAFGYRFLDAGGRELPPGGGPLERLRRIEPARRPDGDFVALADVTSPLTGPRGAARLFGPQKGATVQEVERLAEGLERLEERLRTDLGVDVAKIPGAGAAGGLGAGCAAFLGARLERGSEWVLSRVGFEKALGWADLVVTGEGAWDASSREGKIVYRVLTAARAAGVPTLLLCGRAEGPSSGADLTVDGAGALLDAPALARLAASGVRRLMEERPGA